MDWNLLSAVFTAVFGIAAMVLSLKLANRKKPVWAYATSHIIGRDADAPPELRYMFGDKEVTEVYRTRIVLFNAGNEKYCGDVAPPGSRDINEPIVVDFKGAQILRSPTVLKHSKGVANQFTVTRDTGSGHDVVTLHVPILNHNDGALFEVWHTKCPDNPEITNSNLGSPREFVGEPSRGFRGNLIAGFALVAGSLAIAAYLAASTKRLADSVAPVLFFVGLAVVLGLSLRKEFRFMTFPRWTRDEDRKIMTAK